MTATSASLTRSEVVPGPTMPDLPDHDTNAALRAMLTTSSAPSTTSPTRPCGPTLDAPQRSNAEPASCRLERPKRVPGRGPWLARGMVGGRSLVVYVPARRSFYPANGGLTKSVRRGTNMRTPTHRVEATRRKED